jgi:hypothetical protein
MMKRYVLRIDGEVRMPGAFAFSDMMALTDQVADVATLIPLQRHLIFSHVLSFICPFHPAHTVLDQDG